MLRLEVQVLSLAPTQMRYKFYDSSEYKVGQAEVTRSAWLSGVYKNRVKPFEKRNCKNYNCGKSFRAKGYDPKKFCSKNCSAIHNNLLRGPQTLEVKRKISKSLQGRPNPRKGILTVPRFNRNCLNCGKGFITPRWQNHIYCSVACSINDIGGRPTSPKAARAKSGIRPDIDPNLYFFSRWEANFARILNLLNIKWEFQYKTFDLKSQKYTPDFYIVETDTYIEIKNFL